MNDNLFIKLHKLASAQDENFITETFAHIFRRLIDTDSDAAFFILNKIVGDFLQIDVEELCSVSISTQVLTPYGTPDIEIKAPAFLAYIEAKVESGFGFDQLERYRKALNQSSVENSALITVTRYPLILGEHKVPPDKSFRWHQLVEWLERLELSNKVSAYLVHEFIDFMKLRGIAMESVGWELSSGVRSFQNLLTMLSEALAANDVNIYSKSGAWDWHGYYIEDKKFFIGLYLSNPTVVEINTEVPLKSNIPDNLEIGIIEGGCWENRLDLSAENIHFFARSKASQLLCLEQFIKDSLDFGRSLIG